MHHFIPDLKIYPNKRYHWYKLMQKVHLTFNKNAMCGSLLSMRTIARLFGKSPFSPLKAHMKKVASCITKLEELLKAFQKEETEKLEKLAKQISELEYEADLTKNDLRNHLPKTLFLPIDRFDLLDILHLQDAIADTAEQIGITLTLHSLPILPILKEPFEKLCKKTLQSFEKTNQVLKEMDTLLETTFGGLEAEKVKAMVDEVALKEHENSKLTQNLKKLLFSETEKIPHYTFYLWLNLIEEIGNLSKVCEKLSNRIRVILDVS
ncbi:MAG: hypothetical protein K940chlam8_00237 [Chlamydiae bacterium]|nr:hypothetical protein [Chlamydiota bacterium]